MAHPRRRGLEANKEYLTELDAAIGDADHGNNMARGFNAVVDALPAMEGQDIGAMLKRTGMVLMSKVGGASGMLYSNFFLKAAAGAAGKDELTDAELGELLTSGLGGIVQRGRAEPGDKTMIDAWNPAVARSAQPSPTPAIWLRPWPRRWTRRAPAWRPPCP
ncbi:MAG: dihydroxyacetone kinase subunit DhaL [Caldilineaceae bacterium]